MNILYKSGTAPATTIYMTSTILQCPVGYYWIDAASIKNSSCQANGRWSPVPPCIGKSLTLFRNCCNYISFRMTIIPNCGIVFARDASELYPTGYPVCSKKCRTNNRISIQYNKYFI